MESVGDVGKIHCGEYGDTKNADDTCAIFWVSKFFLAFPSLAVRVLHCSQSNSDECHFLIPGHLQLIAAASVSHQHNVSNKVYNPVAVNEGGLGHLDPQE